jgi:hypothetical protein
MSIVHSADAFAEAQARAKRIQKAYGLREIEQAIDEILARQVATEEAYLNSGEIVARHGERVAEVKSAVKLRESELLNEAMGASQVVGQQIEAVKDTIKAREAEIMQEIEGETIQDPKKPDDPDARIGRYMTSTGRKTEHGVRKSNDEKLAQLKKQLKELESQKVEPASAAEKNRIIAQAAAGDAELQGLKGELAAEEARMAEAQIAANKAKAAFNALQREYHLTLRRLDLRAATMRALAGFELDVPAPAPIATTIPQAVDPALEAVAGRL